MGTSDGTLRGTLHYADAPGTPIHHFRVVLRGTDAAGAEADLATTETDLSGAFTFEGFAGTATAVVGTERVRTYDEAGAANDAYEPAFEVAVPDGADALGEVGVPFWSYRDDRPVPRAGLNADGKTDQQHAPGYLAALGAGLAATRPIFEGLMGRLMGGEQLSIAEIQSHFPESLTSRIDRMMNHSRSDAWLGELVLNGFNTQPLQRPNDGTERFAMAFDWGQVTSDGVHDISNVIALFELQHGKLMPVEIRSETLEPAGPGEWKPAVERTTRPGDAHWEHAKHIFRCQYLLSGALDAHIIKTHLVVEQYCIAAYRQLRKSPIRDLLLPYLAEVVVANTDADDFAWGPNGQIPQGSVLKFPTDVEARMKLLLGQMDWRGWRPRTPISGEHKYAHLLAAFWDVAVTYVDAFFATHQAEIESHWEEVRRFSHELWAHSVPRVDQPPAEGFSWVDTNELPTPGPDAQGHSITPITSTSSPGPDDIGRLKEMCCYLLTQATFIHTWVHQGQYEVGGDMNFASLSLRGGSVGDMASTGPLPAEAASGLFINSNGRRVNFGLLLANEAGDVPPELRQLLGERADAFRELGYDVKRIRSRINI